MLFFNDKLATVYPMSSVNRKLMSVCSMLFVNDKLISVLQCCLSMISCKVNQLTETLVKVFSNYLSIGFMFRKILKSYLKYKTHKFQSVSTFSCPLLDFLHARRFYRNRLVVFQTTFLYFTVLIGKTLSL